MSGQIHSSKGFLQDGVKGNYISKQNHLLASLPPDLYQNLALGLKQVSLKQGQKLLETTDQIQTLYFPIDCLLSITITMGDGAIVETGIIGCREMLGLNAFLGGTDGSQTEYTVQIAGTAIKADAQIWRKEFDCNLELRKVILSYTQSFIVQISQTAACNRIHFLEHRLARWLLEAQDRINSDNLRLTHEFLAMMLGVRRAGVTQAAQNLQDKAIIQYKRGNVQILDQAGLEEFSCECFGIVKNEYDRLLGTRCKGSV